MLKFIVRRTKWPDDTPILAGAMASFAWRGYGTANTNIDDTTSIRELMLEWPDFEVDLEDGFNLHDNPVTILESQPENLHLLPSEDRLSLAMREEHLPPHKFLKLAGVENLIEKTATLRCRDGRTILHHVAKRLVDPSQLHIAEWKQLGGVIIRSCSDPSDVVSMSLLLDAIEWFRIHRLADKTYLSQMTLNGIRAWCHMLKIAGIDIFDYGLKELQFWRQIGLLDSKDSPESPQDPFFFAEIPLRAVLLSNLSGE